MIDGSVTGRSRRLVRWIPGWIVSRWSPERLIAGNVRWRSRWLVRWIAGTVTGRSKWIFRCIPGMALPMELWKVDRWDCQTLLIG